MKLAIVQFCPQYAENQKNKEIIIDISENTNADLIVFPELSTSGYFFKSREQVLPYADSFQEGFCRQMQEIATRKDRIIVYGFPEIDKNTDELFNSAAILFPDASLSKVYRKTHLFYKEHFFFSPGNTGFFVIEDKSRDFLLGTMICYDWRFPEAARTLALKGADLIVCPSNLVTHLWHGVMPARAVENKVYFAVANRTGTEVNDGEELFFNGESAIYDYNGKQICKAGIKEEQILFAEIEPQKTRNKSFNEFNDLFKDRRPDLYV